MSFVGGVTSQLGRAAGEVAGQALQGQLAPALGDQSSAMGMAAAAQSNAASWAYWSRWALPLGIVIGAGAAAAYYRRTST
jgi:hypothetical protein